MEKQDLRVSDGSTAVQSGRDTHIHHGLTPKDVQGLLKALGEQFPAMLEAAKVLVDARFADFEAQIVERFSKDADPNACADPDFVYGLRLSQHTYARCGDERIRDTLIDLVAQRSRAQTHSRLALTLNEAILRAGALTKNEFAELSLCYLIKYTLFRSVRDLAGFGKFFETQISPLLDDVSEHAASYQHIEAQSCGNMSGGFISVSGVEVLRRQYGGVLTGGLEKARLEDAIPEKYRTALNQKGLIGACINDPTKYQLQALNAQEFCEVAQKSDIGMSVQEATSIWNSFSDNAVWKDEVFFEKVEPVAPNIRKFARTWEKTSLGALTLTTVGIAIAHSNIVRLTGFDGKIDIWIK